MIQRRSERHERGREARGRLTRIGVLAGVGVLAIALAVGLAVHRANSSAGSAEVTEPVALPQTAAAEVSVVGTATADALVELPSVVGMPVDEAEGLLGVAGFVVTRMPTPAGETTEGVVLSQDPAAGLVAATGSTVTLVFASTHIVGTGYSQASGVPVVCLDPGHQDRANIDPEPIGPGAQEMKPKVTGGATGVVTRQAEPALTLALAEKVKSRLELRGVRVVMTRTTGAVDISNRQRAEVANAARAALFVRLHADGNANAGVRGISTLYPGGNDWVAPIEAESLAAATAVHKAVLGSSGADDRRVVRRADLSGFNWATVPSILIECGFLTNPAEDRLLSDPAYQDKLADGITVGILTYLAERGAAR